MNAGRAGLAGVRQARRRRTIIPTDPSPASIDAQVSGSGTGDAVGTLAHRSAEAVPPSCT